MEDKDYPLKDECYHVIGCCMKVHTELGSGFLEPVYQEALSYELAKQYVPYSKEKVLDIYYDGRVLNKKYVADFVCFESLIVEVKATENLAPEHLAQVINYLKATKHKVALLINFGSSKLQYKRVIL